MPGNGEEAGDGFDQQDQRGQEEGLLQGGARGLMLLVAYQPTDRLPPAAAGSIRRFR